MCIVEGNHEMVITLSFLLLYYNMRIRTRQITIGAGTLN